MFRNPEKKGLSSGTAHLLPLVSGPGQTHGISAKCNQVSGLENDITARLTSLTVTAEMHSEPDVILAMM